VDGYVAGVWRATPEGIEVCGFEPIAENSWAELEHEARLLGDAILSRDPTVFGRYDHWWEKLAAGERRTLSV
jgi:hypothetical protein